MKTLGTIIRKRVITPWISISVMALFLSGCNQKELSELEAYVHNVKNRPARPIEPIPTIKPYLRFIYPGHNVDPFDRAALAPSSVPVVMETGKPQVVDRGIQLDQTRVKQFMERYPLDALRMVGSVYQQNELWALVKIPDGGIQRVKRGNYIGRNHGKITKVTDSMMELKELIPNGFGGYKERDNKVLLRLE